MSSLSPKKRKRTSSQSRSSSVTEPSNKTRMRTPKEYVDEAWGYVQPMSFRGDHLNHDKLNTILENMKLEPIKKACEEQLLKNKCNAIHNKIRDLTENWNESKRGGKKTRRSSKKSNKRKSHKKKQF